ncbi:hypothetical protein CASFOL_024093 [Castilleja foliolosa]|uniref:Uncharacterized protein n=1 Tax=Castilleja foliolosa TaxID=1961234 RepID=A0ABD3CNI8_9LAMI
MTGAANEGGGASWEHLGQRRLSDYRREVRVSCEKVAEIAVAFSGGGSGGCAWPDAADLEEATGLRRGSGWF